LVKVDTKSESAGSISISFIRTFTAESTTAALACARRGVILSQMLKRGTRINKKFTSNLHYKVIYIFFFFFFLSATVITMSCVIQVA